MHQSCTNRETDESNKASERNISDVFGEAALDSHIKTTILKYITTPIKISSKEEQLIMGLFMNLKPIHFSIVPLQQKNPLVLWMKLYLLLLKKFFIGQVLSHQQ